jgi:hypothetical protein
MCCGISLVERAQPIPGFPAGFKFAFEGELQPKNCLRCRINVSYTEELSTLWILQPNGEQLRYYDVRHACKDVTEDMLRSLCSYVGIVRYKDDVYNLLGKGYRQEWTNLAGMKQAVIGKVVSCSTRVDGGSLQEFLTIVYEEPALSTMNTQDVPFKAALGGVISYKYLKEKRKISNPVNCTGAAFCLWRTPEIRKTNLVLCHDGIRRPKVTIQFREWELIFFVKQSTIRKAGLGCFVRCTELSKSRNSKFDVQLGELLDIGVYAPLRDEDRKTKTIFKLKNFVHSYAPEEWVFGSADGNLDVRVAIDHFCFFFTHLFWFYKCYPFFLFAYTFYIV